MFNAGHIGHGRPVHPDLVVPGSAPKAAVVAVLVLLELAHEAGLGPLDA